MYMSFKDMSTIDIYKMFIDTIKVLIGTYSLVNCQFHLRPPSGGWREPN